MIIAPVAPSPQRAFTTVTERLSASRGPLPSSATTGTTKNVAIDQAAPAIQTAILPANATYSSSTCRIRPTVVVTSVQPRIGPMRPNAAENPSLTLVSSPRTDRVAQAASATLKNTPMNVATNAEPKAAM